MAWDEWEQLKSDAAERRATRMRLNQLPPEAGGGPPPQGDLKVNQKDLAEIGNAAFLLYGDLEKTGDHARASTQKAASGLTSETFALGAALDHVASRWIDQVRSLLDACAHISNHLDFTKGAHAGDEVYISTVISGIDTLDKGFDERAGS
ncbi:hypothetical protein CP967_21625 [Streptomyces nitrosporeus]|uniref:AG1 protein n=1 Tax=Streptomyces nitrosporeus TaxID=28894 RepID=A0A5J6FH37_9ACTN|nr:hypothetical protein [Streptomyces nitrosporeus]QEU74245.1 hypothetical protein CP967_21625 [Streptomyces nitrosporeus]GGY96976.1 hypothetical protein GCM10010327_29580 [Streptomyces nitrosporeus]